MGEVLLVCSLITLLLVVYFIYIKEREDKKLQIDRNRQAYCRYNMDPRYSKYNSRTNNIENSNSYNPTTNNFGRSGEYLKFLKFKNTPPPQDLKPKQLKYENYNNLQILENYYNYNQKQLNILTPTPFKHDQVLAGNIQIENKIKNVYQINSNSNINFNGVHNAKGKGDIVGYKYIKDEKVTNAPYVSRYPVDISHKKRQITKNDLLADGGAFYPAADDYYNKMNNELVGQNNFHEKNTNLNNKNTKLYSNNNYGSSLYNPNLNKVSYKVINAEDFLRKKNAKIGVTSEKKNLHSVSISPLRAMNNLPNLNDKYNPNYVNNNAPNINPNIRQDVQNINYQRNERNKIINEEEEIIPRKLRFSDSSFNEKNLLSTNKGTRDVWFSPTN